MPLSDRLMLLTLALGLVAFPVRFRRRGARGVRLAVAALAWLRTQPACARR